MKKLIIVLVCTLLICIMKWPVEANERQFDAGVIALLDTEGNNIGRAQFTEVRKKGVHIHIEASHLTPGPHGFHIHEYGKCEPPDFASAGAHFNPTGKQHGHNNPKGFHLGDLPNLEVGKDGTVVADFYVEGITLEKGKPNSIIKEGGTSLVIHELADDLKTDPSGNSGKRIACGIIE